MTLGESFPTSNCASLLTGFSCVRTPRKARSLDRLGLSVQLDGVCTSLELAEISGREHKNVIRDIEAMEANITDETHSMLGILRSTYVDGRGRQQPQRCGLCQSGTMNCGPESF